MEDHLNNLIEPASWPVLLAIVGGSICVLGKAADWLVTEAVALSERSGVPKVVIGATVVSLGTTMPEAAVSVLAALQGSPGLALGNAVGSIICDTGLVLGLACLVSPLAIPRYIVNRQGWLQVGAVVLLVAVCFPWFSPTGALADGTGGRLPQSGGFVFLLLLAIYLWLSARWSRQKSESGELDDLEGDVRAPLGLILVKLIAAITLVVCASKVLIPAVTVMAERMLVPQSIIAVTLVAFGTSLPELVTAVTAAYHKHGDLAIGNVIGADVLNVLFVAGASAAVTTGGLHVSSHFFLLHFPIMLFVVCVFRAGTLVSGDKLGRGFGVVLLASYLAALALTYFSPTTHHEEGGDADVRPVTKSAEIRKTAANPVAYWPSASLHCWKQTDGILIESLVSEEGECPTEFLPCLTLKSAVASTRCWTVPICAANASC